MSSREIVFATGLMVALGGFQVWQFPVLAIVAADLQLAWSGFGRWALEAFLVLLTSTAGMSIKQVFLHR